MEELRIRCVPEKLFPVTYAHDGVLPIAHLKKGPAFYLDWNPDAAIKMTKNPYDFGEHIFIIEGLKFSDAVDLKFIGQNTGWGPYDAGFEVGGEMTAPVSWAKIKEGDGSADLKFKDQAGTYTVLFDYYYYSRFQFPTHLQNLS